MLFEVIDYEQAEPIDFFDSADDAANVIRGVFNGIGLGLAFWLVVAAAWLTLSA